MSRDQNTNDGLIVSKEQLVDYFRQGEKPASRRRIGTESEKFVIRKNEGRMLSFEEPGGFADLFDALVERFGWQYTEPDDGHIVAVIREDGAITLEPGGQLELSGAIFETVFETAKEFDTHMEELKACADDDLIFTMWGVNPVRSLDEVPWMPKSRYKIMREYMPTRGDLAHWMMKATCTVQGNFDYTSEEDAADMVRTAVLAGPMVGALFANSPIRLGEPTGYQSFRNYIWTRTDPDRSGVPSFMYGTDWGYEDYLNYIFEVPMFFIIRDGQYINMTGYSFADFVKNGYQGHKATMGDFVIHLSTAFPDVRMKQFIEVRNGDAGPREALLALPALWKGILYDDQARQQVKDLFDPLSEKDHRELNRISYTDGIHGDSPYGPIAELAEQLVQFSDAGLQRLAAQNGHQSESVFLDPLRERLATKKSWADLFTEDFEEIGPDLAKLAERWAL